MNFLDGNFVIFQCRVVCVLVSPRSVIPPTMIPERPDISIFCPDCTRYIDLRVRNEHKTYHKSLEIMKFKGIYYGVKSYGICIKEMKNRLLEIQSFNNSSFYPTAF